MTIGIRKERIEEHIERLHRCSRYYDRAVELSFCYSLLRECTELDPWLPIEEAPKDRQIVVYAPPYQDLESIVSKCQWHEDAGFCIDELRQPTLWQDLPKDR